MNEAAALARAFVPYTEEAFLLALTNRGIYNRALKDYGALSPPPAVAVENGAITVDLGDAQVTLNQNIAQSRCTCPSRATCKHILMALFAVRDFAASGFAATGGGTAAGAAGNATDAGGRAQPCAPAGGGGEENGNDVGEKARKPAPPPPPLSANGGGEAAYRLTANV